MFKRNPAGLIFFFNLNFSYLDVKLIFNCFICYTGTKCCCHRHRTRVSSGPSMQAQSVTPWGTDFQTFSLSLELHLWPLLFWGVQLLQRSRYCVPWLSNRQTSHEETKQPLPMETNLIDPFLVCFFETSPHAAKQIPNCCEDDLELLSPPPASVS